MFNVLGGNWDPTDKKISAGNSENSEFECNRSLNASVHRMCRQFQEGRGCEVAVPEGEGSALGSSTACSPGHTGTPQSLLPHSPHCVPVLVHKPPSSVADLGMPEERTSKGYAIGHRFMSNQR